VLGEDGEDGAVQAGHLEGYLGRIEAETSKKMLDESKSREDPHT